MLDVGKGRDEARLGQRVWAVHTRHELAQFRHHVRERKTLGAHRLPSQAQRGAKLLLQQPGEELLDVLGGGAASHLIHIRRAHLAHRHVRRLQDVDRLAHVTLS